MKVHVATRKRKLVEKMSECGLSISFDRLMDISSFMGNRVCEKYCKEIVVCPPNLQKHHFTTAAVDNIDHNPSSNTAADAFHGTGISLFQHPENPTDEYDGDEQPVAEGSSQLKTKFELPESYTSVQPITLKKNDIVIPDIGGPVEGDATDLMKKELKRETDYV